MKTYASYAVNVSEESETPFDDLFAVHNWMVETKRLTSAADEIDRQIRNVLLDGTIETLNPIMSLAGDPAHPLLEQLVNTSTEFRQNHRGLDRVVRSSR